MLAILAPGQGSQRPGVLTDWLAHPRLAAELADWEQTTGLPLRYWGSEAAAAELTATAAAQLGVLTAGLLAGRALLAAVGPDQPLVLAGHSVGEWTAAALAGVLTPVQALQCVSVRSAAMSRACAREPGGMVAVLGGEPGQVQAAAAAAGLVLANHNGAGQVVVAGPEAALARFLADPPPGRLKRLPVEGAFHTAAMQPAGPALERALAELAPADPGALLLSGLDGAAVRSGSQVAGRLVAQVTEPVRFDLVLAELARLPLTAVVELPPAGVLAGLARRALPDVPVLTLTGPADVDRLPQLAGEAR